ncbi:FkbM family methyltransferase [Halomarina litorea]|uniref:FkbM family methyltransferase n=1 Tax=Halomarina litorea TaxID=2961595 RepID=UPI0020C5A8D6|nr:FkbM family methyltransferase [Halomarina sp. BCD28]
MTLTRRFRSVTRAPARVPTAVGLVARKFYRLLSAGRFAQAAGYASEFVGGENRYWRRYADRTDGRYVVAPVHDYRMWLDTADPGISRTLLAFGIHEYASSRAFRRELERLAGETDRPVALEIGANIGYFSLLEAAALGPSAHVYAVEPTPENADLLERNLRLNGFEDRTTVARCAVGDVTGPATLYLSDLSNQHSVRPEGGDGRAHEGGSVSVEMLSAADLLGRFGLAPEEVNVVRMDLEGYETVVLDQLRPVLESAGPTVVYVELHPLNLSDEELRAVVSLFRDNGFEPASTVVHETAAGLNDWKSWHGHRLNLPDMDAVEAYLLRAGHAVELIARK